VAWAKEFAAAKPKNASFFTLLVLVVAGELPQAEMTNAAAAATASIRTKLR
jgi:hypothetical protein